jgi:hypothetical protein
MNEYANIPFKLTIEYEIDNSDIKCCDFKINEDDDNSIKQFIKKVKQSDDKRIQFISSIILNKDIITDIDIKNKFN